jgi:Cu+-exporting ATPase
MLFSLLFNCLGIPIAAGALYPATRRRLPPEVAGLAMALSSVCVVVSSLLLRQYCPPTLPMLPELEPSNTSAVAATTSALHAGDKAQRASSSVEALKGRAAHYRARPSVAGASRAALEPTALEMKTQLTNI